MTEYTHPKPENGDTAHNATLAAIRAGYSVNSARQTASRMMTNVDIQQAIAKRVHGLAEKADISVERILQEWERIGFGDPRDVMTWGPNGVELKESVELTDDQAAMVAEVKQTISPGGGSISLKLHDKKGILDSMAKYMRMLVDLSEHKSVVLTRELTDDELRAIVAGEETDED